MPVAPSFQNMTFLTEPYLVGNKLYIKVRNEKTGNERQVRFYSEKEYNKLYPNKNVIVNNGHNYGSQKKCLGFENGPITFFVGDIVKNESFFDQWIDARYHVLWGWYVINGIDISNITLPKNVYPVELNWQSVGDENGYLKSKEEIQKTIRKIAKIVKESL